MRERKWVVAAASALALFWVTAAAAEKAERPRGRPERAPLTEEQKAVLARAKDLQKQLKIAGLELALLEAKEASEDDIAQKAEQTYRLQGRLYALRSKNPEVARELHRDRMRGARGRGFGFGRGRGGRGWGGGRRFSGLRGPAEGRGGGPGHPGMGFGRGRGGALGRGLHAGLGPGRLGHGRQAGRGPGRLGRGRRAGLGPGEEMRNWQWEGPALPPLAPDADWEPE